MVEQGDAKTRIKRITKGLKGESNITTAFEGPKWAFLQALFARGDRRLLDLIGEMANQEPASWQRLLKQWQLNPDYYALRQRDDRELLPWSFYATQCSREDEYAR
jgi:hypothetical protein